MKKLSMKLAGFGGMAIVCVACAEPPPGEETAQSVSAASTQTMNRVLTNAELTGDDDVTASKVQALFVLRGSALASYSEGGRSAAKIVVDEARAEGISPTFILSRIEGESGLLSSGTLAHIASATGCGCPDNELCDPSVANFGPQVRCAAQSFRAYLDQLADDNSTISGWGVGVGRWTLDGCWVVPANAATAALYTYTPWVGAYADECGTSQWGGTSLMGVLYRALASQLDTLTPAPNNTCQFGDGFYCDGASTIHRCTQGWLSVEEECASGCTIAPPGEPDTCN